MWAVLFDNIGGEIRALGNMTLSLSLLVVAATHINWLSALRLPKPLMVLRVFSMSCGLTFVVTTLGPQWGFASLRTSDGFALVCFLFACSSSALLYMIHRLEYVVPGKQAHA